MHREMLSIDQKALAINLDHSNYGTFAEIGAGQETVNHFFKSGGAAGTIAKSMSAYDMTFSDAIYGREKNGRYVCRDRLLRMLDHENSLLKERLGSVLAIDTTLFVFANTVTTKSYTRKNECHGWLGVRFQTKRKKEHNDIVLHMRMLDNDYLLQQEVVGFVGVNLIYATFYLRDKPSVFIESLVDNISKDRVEIDMVAMSGPDCKHIDNHLLSLQLVKQGLSKAIIFDKYGKLRQPAELLYKRPVLIQRGNFRPITHVNMEMQACAIKYFLQEPEVKEKKPLTLMEITLSNLTSEGEIEEKDFLDRIYLLTALGHSVLISNFSEHYQFANYIGPYCKSRFVLVLGVSNLKETMKEKHYQQLDGGILEAFGKLFTKGGRLYVYPEYDEKTKSLQLAENLQVEPHLKHLYHYLLDNRFIVDLKECDISKFNINAKEILKMIQTGKTGWEKHVPEKVVTLIKDKNLWREK